MWITCEEPYCEKPLDHDGPCGRLARKCEVCGTEGCSGYEFCTINLLRSRVGQLEGQLARAEAERDDAQSLVADSSSAAARQVAAAVRERNEALVEVERLKKLAYLGDHHFEDLTYKARLEELVSKHRALEVESAKMREALLLVREAMTTTGQEPDGVPDPRRPVATAVWTALGES